MNENFDFFYITDNPWFNLEIQVKFKNKVFFLINIGKSQFYYNFIEIKNWTEQHGVVLLK